MNKTGAARVWKYAKFAIPLLLVLLGLAWLDDYRHKKGRPSGGVNTQVTYQSVPTFPKELAEQIEIASAISAEARKLDESLRFSTLPDQTKRGVHKTIDTFLTLNRSGELINKAKNASARPDSAEYINAVVELSRENKDNKLVLARIRRMCED